MSFWGFVQNGDSWMGHINNFNLYHSNHKYWYYKWWNGDDSLCIHIWEKTTNHQLVFSPDFERTINHMNLLYHSNDFCWVYLATLPTFTGPKRSNKKRPWPWQSVEKHGFTVAMANSGWINFCCLMVLIWGVLFSSSPESPPSIK